MADSDPWYERPAVVVAAGVGGLVVIALIVFAVIQTSRHSVGPSGTTPTTTTTTTTTTRRTTTTTRTTTQTTTPTTTPTTETTSTEPTTAETTESTTESPTATTIPNPYLTTTAPAAGAI